MTRKLVLLLLMASLTFGYCTAQSGIQSALGADVPEPSEVSRVKILAGDDSVAIEITSTHQVIPSVTRLDGPLPHLIIGLPNAELSVSRKRIDIHRGDIRAVRLVQYHMRPPVVQVIVDLIKPHSYTWEAAGNRLIVRLQHAQQETQAREVPAQTPLIALAKAIDPTAVSASLPNSGHLVLLDNLASGASVSGGADTAVLRLSRGEIDVCPGTAVSVTRSQDRAEMMVAVSTGALETHYALEHSTDSILTPDFRIVLRGPGEFHYAIKVDSRGSACVRALPRNTGSVIVSELMGNGEHEVRSGDQLVFHAGRFTDVNAASPESCGCSEPAAPVMQTFLPPPDTAPLPALSPSEVHVLVDVPLVFPDQNRQEDKRAGLEESRNQVHVDNVPQAAQPAGVISIPSPSQTQTKPSRSGFLGKIEGFVREIFR